MPAQLLGFSNVKQLFREQLHARSEVETANLGVQLRVDQKGSVACGFGMRFQYGNVGTNMLESTLS